MLDEYKIKVLRGVASWSLSGIGVWVMMGVYFLAVLGPRLMSVAALLASVFMFGFLLFRLGLTLNK